MDLKQHLLRQMAFSHATFGPGERTHGVCEHIRKELIEVMQAMAQSEHTVTPPGCFDSHGRPLAVDAPAEEWVDVVILALDGLTRRLAYMNGSPRIDPEVVADYACMAILRKQSRNEARSWPDWRTASKDSPIEHDRTGE